ncbi:hypothetical protein NM688_g4685 [Phlebia brevispora]|uniref:Uncharacterized protein n=1 Tax=Phlebia brevispora TaxID=194682 RepID=A0ACC1T259_9APHY|nr:hypothetical protein NM688_g4685 [Phlebia brevispora]
MSTNASNSEVISVYETNLLGNYFVVAALTVACYEFAITFRYQYEFSWQRRSSGATWLFFANWYSTLAAIIVQVAPSSAEVLFVMHLWHSLNSTAAFSALRVFALFDRARVLAASALGLGLVPVALQLLCSTSLAGLLCTISADVIAIAITWFKTYHHVQQASFAGVNVTFSTTLLQYGTLYFIVLFIVNLAEGLIAIVPAFQTINPIGAFTTVLPNIILSRFLINLRQVDSPEPDSAARSSHFSAPSFRRPSVSSIVGNLGEMLPDGEENPALDDEDHNAAAVYEDDIRADSKSVLEAGMSSVLDMETIASI